MENIKINLNTDIYPAEIIYSAAYSLSDKAYFYFQGEPKKELIVTITNKKNQDITKEEFLERILTYLEFKQTSKENRDIKYMILQRALITNDPSILNDSVDSQEILLSENDIDDLDEISIPWGEKYSENGN